MRCPSCHGQNEKVIDSRIIKEGRGVRRRRECIDCGYRFSTHEEIIAEDLKVVKKDGVREDFDREKLRRGIEKACWKRPVPRDKIDHMLINVAQQIQADFDREVSSLEIGKRVMLTLRELDEVAYIRFASVYRQFKDSAEFINEIQTLNEKREP